MKRLLTFVLLAIASSGAIAGWNPLRKGQGDLGTVYVDPGSIHRRGQIVEMVTMVNFNNAQTLEESATPMFYQSITKRFDFDCRDKLYRMTAYTYYSGEMGTGTVVIGDSSLEDGDWRSVEARTTEADLWEVACVKV